MHHDDTHWVLLSSRSLIALLAVAMLLAACGPRRIAIAPDERSKLKEAPEIIAFRYPSAVLVVITEAFGPATYETVVVKEEPLISLMESFLTAIKAELKLGNIRTLQEPRHHGPEYRFRLDYSSEREQDLIQIRRTFQTGLVFDFDRDGIVFELDPSAHPRTIDLITNGKAHYRVHVWAKASLIRVSEQKILWQGVCDITDGGLTRDDFRQPNNPLVQEKLDTAIKACAQELTAQFLGK